jgi:hypothetical protein
MLIKGISNLNSENSSCLKASSELTLTNYSKNQDFDKNNWPESNFSKDTFKNVDKYDTQKFTVDKFFSSNSSNVKAALTNTDIHSLDEMSLNRMTLLDTLLGKQDVNGVKYKTEAKRLQTE